MWKLLIFFTFFFLLACNSSAPKQTDSKVNQPGILESPAISEDELIIRLADYLSSDSLTQSKKNSNAIANYAIDKLLDVQVKPSGLFYQIIAEGQGAQIAWGDKITVNYTGYFLDGRVFDSSYNRKKPLNFYVGNMISGWNEGLQLIKPGGKILLLIPSELAYGEEGFKGPKGENLVPPNTNLAFEIEVLPN